MENDTPTCGNCPHFRANHAGADYGHCHHSPPTGSEVFSRWPGVRDSDWCGRHPERDLALKMAMAEAAHVRAQEKLRQQQDLNTTRIVVPRRGN